MSRGLITAFATADSHKVPELSHHFSGLGGVSLPARGVRAKRKPGGSRHWLPVILVLVSGFASAAILPDSVGLFKKSPPKSITIPDRELYDEYGLQATEQAEYTAPEKHFTA